MSIHKFQVIFTCAESSRSSQDRAVLWLPSFSIFPTRPCDVPLLMSRLQQQFLGSPQDRWVRFPWEVHGAGHLGQHPRGHVLSSSFWLCAMCLLSRLVTPSYLFPHKSNKPWGGMRETDIKKENSIHKWRNWKVYNTPPGHRNSPLEHDSGRCYSPWILAAWVRSFSSSCG